jgi:fibronectin type 3 domain-containing protein
VNKRLILLFTILAFALLALLGIAAFHHWTRPHRVQLSWHASPPVSGVTEAGYNIYRSTTSGGPYVLIASNVTHLSYTDALVNSGKTYYYTVTSVDQGGRESRYSVEITAVIP